MTAQQLILNWLKARLDVQNILWLEEKAALIATGASDRTVFTSFSAAMRYSNKDPLNLGPQELAEAAATVPGWKPSDWTCEQAARIFLLLSLPGNPKSAKLIDQIYHTADMGEAVALQKSLAVLPYPEGHMAWAREGIRSNIQEVFEAICLRNPYPALHFDEVGWNQVVVKTVFMGLPVREVVGLDRRVNPNLSHMLVDLAFERWAAGREFISELWRCVGPCADARALEGLQKALTQGNPAEKRAAALALHTCPDKQAARILDLDAALAAEVRNGKLTWENFHHGV